MPKGIYLRPSREERFWHYVQKTNSCWLWTGGTFPFGYGQFKIGGKHQSAHRVAYELIKGKIPEGKTLDHLCRNPKCVNPEHLEPVTMRENVLRGIGRSAQNAKKTHCPKGHLLEGNNLVRYQLKKGHRTCRICFNQANREYQERKRRSEINQV